MSQQQNNFTPPPYQQNPYMGNNQGGPQQAQNPNGNPYTQNGNPYAQGPQTNQGPQGQNIKENFQNFTNNVKNTAQNAYQETLKAEQSNMANATGKTKFGVSIAMFAAFIYAVQYFSGFTSVILIFAYLYFFEKNEFLKMTAIKAFILDVGFSIVLLLVGLVPDGLMVIKKLLGMVSISTSMFTIPDNLIYIIEMVLRDIKMLLFLFCIFNSAKGKEIKIPFVEKIYKKC